MPFTLNQLRVFNAVIRHRSVSKAATALGVTQPAVSSQISKLEQDHGVVLFERRGVRATRPTDLGRDLFRITQALDDVEDRATALLREADTALQATHLRFATASPEVLMALLGRLKSHLGDFTIESWTGPSRLAMTRLADREVEFGLFPVADPDQYRDQIIAYPVVRQTLMFLVPSDHPLASSPEPISLAAVLDEQPLISRSAESETQQLADGVLTSLQLSPKRTLKIEDRIGAYEAVAAGLGGCFVLSRDVPQDKRLAGIRLKGVDAEISECLCILRSRAELPAVRRLLELAKPLIPF